MVTDQQATGSNPVTGSKFQHPQCPSLYGHIAHGMEQNPENPHF